MKPCEIHSRPSGPMPGAAAVARERRPSPSDGRLPPLGQRGLEQPEVVEERRAGLPRPDDEAGRGPPDRLVAEPRGGRRLATGRHASPCARSRGRRPTGRRRPCRRRARRTGRRSVPSWRPSRCGPRAPPGPRRPPRAAPTCRIAGSRGGGLGGRGAGCGPAGVAAGVDAARSPSGPGCPRRSGCLRCGGLRQAASVHAATRRDAAARSRARPRAIVRAPRAPRAAR